MNTSQQAYDSIIASAPNLREIVLQYIRDHGPVTCEEVEDGAAMKHQTCSARFCELKKMKLIEEAGMKRTSSGRNAVAYRAAMVQGRLF